jgi:pyruvate formate lyase activating enzyme
MEKGTIFDIQELCVHDGPGPRTTVFMKGCAMRCRWCHNPEGQRPYPEIMRGAGCLKCGNCKNAKTFLDSGKDREAVRLCEHGFLKVAGREVDSDELAEELMRYAGSLSAMGGGVTVSGGECLLQSRFTAGLLSKLRGVHRAIETAGYAEKEDLERALPYTELIMMDIKLMDDGLHRKWTGVGNEKILKNLDIAAASGVPLIVRVPLIHGVSDTCENLKALALRVKDLKTLECVELLPYNTNAGAKYSMLSQEFRPEPKWNAPSPDHTDIFKSFGIKCRVL